MIRHTKKACVKELGTEILLPVKRAWVRFPANNRILITDEAVSRKGLVLRASVTNKTKMHNNISQGMWNLVIHSLSSDIKVGYPTTILLDI